MKIGKTRGLTVTVACTDTTTYTCGTHFPHENMYSVLVYLCTDLTTRIGGI